MKKTRKCESPTCNGGNPKTFTPKYAWEKYCSSACGSRERQKRYQARHKAVTA